MGWVQYKLYTPPGPVPWRLHRRPGVASMRPLAAVAPLEMNHARAQPRPQAPAGAARQEYYQGLRRGSRLVPHAGWQSTRRYLG